MRIVIDMQGAQSPGSRTRGIGRYTRAITKGILQNAGDHEIILVASGAFPEAVEELRQHFPDVVAEGNFRVWHPLKVRGASVRADDWRRDASEVLYESFLLKQDPDIILISSLLEGFEDNAINSIGRINTDVPVGVIFYDLIPHIFEEIYLAGEEIRSWYKKKIHNLKKADFFLSISEASRKDGIKHLEIPEDRIFNVSTDADSQFEKVIIADHLKREVLNKYGLGDQFVMYTGGIDYRKNIEKLIEAFAALDPVTSSNHQLAIVCAASEPVKQQLRRMAAGFGLPQDRLVLTGYVPEDDLIALYNLCKLFVFPSWYEGFGLPALEAMRCGAPVVASDCSSLPEVVGLPEALFDPHSVPSISHTLHHALNDVSFLDRLRSNSVSHAQNFSWDKSAIAAIDACETIYQSVRKEPDRQCAKSIERSPAKPSLALVTPMPPQKSGISFYNEVLLPHIENYYDITIVNSDPEVHRALNEQSRKVIDVTAFKETYSDFDRVLYHMGNSPFHKEIYHLVKHFPGVCMLHDFFLGGSLFAVERSYQWDRAVLASHGYAGLAKRNHSPWWECIQALPTNAPILEQSLGVLFHSVHAIELIEEWYDQAAPEGTQVIPLSRSAPQVADRRQTRRSLGLSDDDVMICSFGFLAPTKLNLEILKAWVASGLEKNRNSRLVFVGDVDTGYREELRLAYPDLDKNDRLIITGWVTEQEFDEYLNAADIAVQLRTNSRGETSAAVWDCLNHGIPTIVNAHGSMAEMDERIVLKIRDRFPIEALASAMLTLHRSPDQREKLSAAGVDYVIENNRAEKCAEQYHRSIEDIYGAAELSSRGVEKKVFEIAGEAPDRYQRHQAEQALALSFPPSFRLPKKYIDITALMNAQTPGEHRSRLNTLLVEMCVQPGQKKLVEPIYLDETGIVRCARRYMLGLLSFWAEPFSDDLVLPMSGDVLHTPKAKQLPETRWPEEFEKLLMSLDIRRSSFDIEIPADELVPAS